MLVCPLGCLLVCCLLYTCLHTCWCSPIPPAVHMPMYVHVWGPTRLPSASLQSAQAVKLYDAGTASTSLMHAPLTEMKPPAHVHYCCVRRSSIIGLILVKELLQYKTHQEVPVSDVRMRSLPR